MEERKYEVKPFNEEEWEEFNKENVSYRLKYGTDLFPIPKCWSIISTHYSHISKDPNICGHIKIDIYKDGKLWFTFYRNYPVVPPFGYFVQNGKEYLITSSNYQCITIINLTDKKMNHYCIGNFEYGGGFCPTDVYVFTRENINIEIRGYHLEGVYGYFILEDVNMDNFNIPQDIEILYDD